MDDLGLVTLGGFVYNAVVEIELVYSTRKDTRGTAYGVDMITVTKQDFDTSQFTFQGEMSGLKLTTSNRGETAMMFSLNTSSTHSLIHLSMLMTDSWWLLGHRNVSYGLHAVSIPIRCLAQGNPNWSFLTL